MGVSIAVFLVFTPFCIWILNFLGDCGFVLIRTSLTVDGALGLYGALLSFAGTVALGILALWQNERIMHINERLLVIEEIDRSEQHTPDLTFTGIEIFTNSNHVAELKPIEQIRGDFNYKAIFSGIPIKDYFEVYLTVKNTSQAKLLKLSYSGYGFILPNEIPLEEKESITGSAKTNQFKKKVVTIELINPQSEGQLSFIPDIKDSTFIYSSKIEFENIFGHSLKNTIAVASEISQNDDLFNIKVTLR